MSRVESSLHVSQYLKDHIRTVPDWPAPGVQFRDITPLLQNPQVFRVLIDAFVHRYLDSALRPDVVAGLDARGFILGAVVAYELNVGFVPIRKRASCPSPRWRRPTSSNTAAPPWSCTPTRCAPATGCC
jgi:adenine phosphoribosyltransferase